MDYTICKQIDGGTPVVMYTVTQEETGSKAKKTAERIFLRIFIQSSKRFKPYMITGNANEFYYDEPMPSDRTQHVRLFMTPVKTKR